VATWKKYLLLQIPGWLATAIVLAVLWHWQLLPRWLALLCFFGWLVKDLILYPLLRHAYEDGAKTGSAALVGARGVAQEALNPSGYVRVRGELWHAVAVPADQVVASGTEVEIVNAERMTVFVRPLRGSSRGGES
jgi:membrane protein implicated in regulation of membrane protease activity